MYQIAYIGRWETLPETAAAICDHDTPKLEALLQGGLDLDVPIQLSEYIKLMPLEIAVFRNDVPMIHFLLEHGADPDLAEEQPLLLTAARCCGPEAVSYTHLDVYKRQGWKTVCKAGNRNSQKE